MVNTEASGKLSPASEIARLRAEFPRVAFIELETSADQRQNTDTLLNNAQEGDAIIVFGGDGTLNDVFTPLLSRDATPAQSRLPLLATRGFGNACDFGAVTNEKLSKSSLSDVLRYGNVVDIYPIAVTMTPAGSNQISNDQEPLLAAGYWDIGATAASTEALERNKEKFKAINSEFKRWLEECKTVFPAFMKAGTFDYRNGDGEQRRALDILFANIPIMAKTGRLPVDPLDRELYVVTLKHANRLTKLSAIAGIATGTLIGKHLYSPDTVSITTGEDTTGLLMQGDGQVKPVPANTTLKVGLHSKPIRAISNKLRPLF